MLGNVFSVPGFWVVSLVFFLTAVLTLVFLVSDLVLKGTFVMNDSFPIGDFLDLTVSSPIFIAVCIALHYCYHAQATTRAQYALQCASIVSTVVLFYGHATHLAGNAIHTTFTELRPQNVSHSALRLMYFLDETLGHILTLGGWYSLLFTCVLRDAQYSMLQCNGLVDRTTGVVQCFAVVTGVVMGVVHTVSFIEGDCPLMGLFLVAPLGIALSLVNSLHNVPARMMSLSEKKRDRNLAVGTSTAAQRQARHEIRAPPRYSIIQLLHSCPMSMICLYACSTLAIGECLYYVKFGGFVQPSHLGGVGCAFFGACKDVIRYPTELLQHL